MGLAGKLGPRQRWWLLLVVFLAAPAITLAVVGIRVAQMERLERTREFEESCTRVARLVDHSLSAALRGLESSLPSALESAAIASEFVIITVDQSGRVTLPREHILLDDVSRSRLNANLGDMDTIERALAAEAQERTDIAVQLYDELIRREPSARTWAELARAQARFKRGERSLVGYLADLKWSTSDAWTPTGVPLAMIAAANVEDAGPSERPRFEPLIRRALARLRRGDWWLNPEARVLYDEELRRFLTLATSKPAPPAAPVAQPWTELGGIAQRAVPYLRSGGTRQYDQSPSAKCLSVWARSRQPGIAWIGAAACDATLNALLDSILQPIRLQETFQVSIEQINGDAIYPPLQPVAKVALAFPLTAVPGWQIRFADAQDYHRFASQALLWHAFIGLLVIMLAGGVIGTIGLGHREMELARLQSEFVSGVTHEFKSPLTSIRLLLERLSEGRLRTRDAAGEYYAAIRGETERLERLVNRVLESQKVQTGERRYTFSPASLVRLVESSITRLTPQAVAKGIPLSLSADSALEPIALDEAAISEALDNLIDNAIKYSHAGATVEVAIDRSDCFGVVEVRDHGIGVDPADMPKIFGRFYRGSRAERHGIQGTGLGLALVKAIVEAHGGTIAARAGPDGGMTFVIRLPYRSEMHGQSLDH